MNEDMIGDVLDLLSPRETRPDIKPVRWMHAGLTCHIMSGGYGALCGYVNIPEDNPAYGAIYSDEITYGLKIHGGITYGDISRISGKSWWLGFDTMHPGDTHEEWTLEAVKAETSQLAEQIAAL